MPAKPRHTDADLIRARIRDGIIREQANRMRLDTSRLPGSAPLRLTPGGGPEGAELELEVERLHDFHELRVPIGAARRPLLRPFIAVMRRSAEFVLRPMLGHQSAFNGATARAIAILRNQAIRHERLLIEHTNVLLDVDRTARRLEREVAPLADRELELDQLALANAFRGTEASVKERQARYLTRFAGRAGVVDLGCGRGEFLELLGQAGIEARGVDADSSMVEHCRAKGLVVEQREAVDYLAGLPDGSLAGIFAAHLIEHLRAFDLVRLVREARRALEPSGVLVVESVNPESLMTFAEFYIDPTHVRPYHAEAIKWLFDEEGFTAVEAELSVDAAAERALPPLAGAGVAAPDFDEATTRLNTLLYGARAYAVAGTTPPADH